MARPTATTRRAFLKAGGVSLFTVGVGGGPAFLARAATAAPGAPRTLVCIFQRGAMDGVMAVPPLSSPELQRARPNLGMSAARGAGADAVLALGDGFGLHPALQALRPLFAEGRLAVVHATGSPDGTRSHFDAQDYMETATPGRKGTTSGWLNRVVGELGHEPAPLRAVAMTRALPRSLDGERDAVAIERLEDFALGLPSPAGEPAGLGAQRGFEALYAATTAELLRETSAATFEATEQLRRIRPESYREAAGVVYPQSPLGRALRQLAQLIKAGVGLQIGFAESGGWDTHVRQGTAQGPFAQRARDLADSIAAFWRDLEDHQESVVVMTMTEFGRTVRENGSGGTDHGHGSCAFLLGHRIAGGRIYGDLPALVPEHLFEGRDLPVTTDFRAVFAEVAARHLHVHDLQAVFPGWAGHPLALFS